MFIARWCQKKVQNIVTFLRDLSIFLSKELHRPRYRMRDVEDMLVSQEFHASFMFTGLLPHTLVPFLSSPKGLKLNTITSHHVSSCHHHNQRSIHLRL
jgi:hypothetical protein